MKWIIYNGISHLKRALKTLDFQNFGEVFAHFLTQIFITCPPILTYTFSRRGKICLKRRSPFFWKGWVNPALYFYEWISSYEE